MSQNELLFRGVVALVMTTGAASLCYRRLRARAARQNRLRLSPWFPAAIAFAAIVFPGFADAQTAPAGDTERVIERTNTGTMVRARFEPPVEKRASDGASRLSADGKRQFELRIHEDDGTDTMEPVTPTSSQDTLDHPTVFYRDVRNAQGELIRHDLYTLQPPEQGGMMMVVTTIYKKAEPGTGNAQAQNPPPAAIPDAVHRSSKYPVHADKDSYSRFFYHLTLAEAQQPVTVIPRVPTDMMKQDSKLSRPGKIVQSALGIPNYSANIMAGIDYSTLTKNGDRWRDWMAIDARNNITYFQLTPAHKLAKDKDGAWDIHVSKDPPPLYDLKKNAGKQ
jgi:hypothetical protein